MYALSLSLSHIAMFLFLALGQGFKSAWVEFSEEICQASSAKQHCNHRTSSSSNKESPQTVAANLETQPTPTVQEKTSVACQIQKRYPQLPTSVNSKVCDSRVAKEDDKLPHVNPDESVIVVIQASIRGFLVLALSTF